MKAKYVAILAVIALGVVSAVAYFNSQQQRFGSTIDAYHCLNNAILCNSLNSIASDLVNLQGNLTAVSTSTSWNPPAVSTTTIATTTVSLTCTTGDAVFAWLTNATATLNGAIPQLDANCGSGNVVNITLGFPAGSPNGSLDYPTGTLMVWTKPLASFLTPPALVTATGTSF
jgi:hypothetical protein